MAPHRHDLAHFSLIMTGRQREASRGSTVDSDGMSMAFKPRNFRHENEFGPDGALLLSISLRHAGENDEEIADGEWRVRPAQSVRREWVSLVRALCATAPDDDEINDLTDDILASLMSGGRNVQGTAAPKWLKRAREAAIELGSSAAAIARDAGVHRVHLSRTYKRYFGVSLSEDRRRNRLSRAAREIIFVRSPLAQASLSAGYADQAHLTRQLRDTIGLTPRMLSRLF